MNLPVDFIEQYFDAALRIVVIDAHCSWCRQYDSESTSSGFLAGVQRLVDVLRYIEEHAAEPLRRDDLAAAANLSPHYFDAVFKDIMGLTPQEYIKRFRIRRAQELLLQADLPIAEVAAGVGYRNPFHFSRQFHAVCGISPMGYRQQLRQSLLSSP